MTGLAREILANALFPGGSERPSQQVRAAWHAALLAHAEMRRQLRVVATGEHILDLIPSAGTWDSVAGVPAGLDAWWMREAAAWQRRMFQLSRGGLPGTLRVAIPDGRAGAVVVALFDFLEAACRSAALCREPWPLARVAVEATERAEHLVSARHSINGFWDRDPDLIWEGEQRCDRLPVVWSCSLSDRRPAALAASWTLDSPTLDRASPAAPGGGRPALAPPVGLAGEAIGCYFLERHFGHPHFRPGQWEVIARALSGRSSLAALPRGSGRALSYLLPALLLPGAAVVAAPADVAERRILTLSRRSYAVADRLDARSPESTRHEVLARVEGGAVKLLYVTPELLQEQPFVQRLRGALRGLACGASLFVVEDADLGSEWSDSFRPAFAHVPAALAEVGDAPLLVLSAADPAMLVEDLRRQFRIAEGDVVAAGYVHARGTLWAPAAAPAHLDHPGYKFEMHEHREQFERLSRLVEKGGFASLPAFMQDLPLWDAPEGRAARVRTWLARLQGLGHITSFGESRTTFFVKHEPVPENDLSTYLGRLRARAAELLRGELTPELANADAGDLCETLVRRVLRLSWREARLTALFFDKYIAPFLHQKGSIQIAKAAPPPPERGPETERLLYRLKRLGVIRDYFAEPRTEQADEPLRWGVAVRRFDRAAFEPGLRAALGAFSLDDGTIEALTGEFAAACGPLPAAQEIVLHGLETYLKAYYAVHVRRRQRARLPGSLESGAAEEADLLDLDTAEEWHQAALRRERDRLTPLLDQEVETLARSGALRETVGWFQARSRLWSLRELAGEHAAAAPGHAVAHLLGACAQDALGLRVLAIESACRALRISLEGGRAGAARAIVGAVEPAVRLGCLDREGEILAAEFGSREPRRWRYAACLEVGRPRSAALELLAELRPISKGWRTACGDLAALDGLLARLAAV